MQRTLAEMLPDFGGGMSEPRPKALAGLPSFEPVVVSKPAEAPPAAAMPKPAPVPQPTPAPAAPAVDMREAIAAEVASAEARIRQELSAAYEADLNVERQRLADIQASFAAEVGSRIAAEWDGVAAHIASITTGATAEILSSFLVDDVARRSIDQLSRTIRASLADRGAVRFRIAGPAPLFENLKETLGPLAAQCDFTEAAGFDLNVAIEGSVIETRIAEWSTRINEVSK